MKNKTRNTLNRISAAFSAAVLSVFVLASPMADSGSIYAFDETQDTTYEVLSQELVNPNGDPLYIPDESSVADVIVPFDDASKLSDGTVSIAVTIPDAPSETLSADTYSQALAMITSDYQLRATATYAVTLNSYTMADGESIVVPTSVEAPMISGVYINGLIVPLGASATLSSTPNGGCAVSVTGLSIDGTLNLTGGGHYDISQLGGRMEINDDSVYTMSIARAYCKTRSEEGGTICISDISKLTIPSIQIGLYQHCIPAENGGKAVVYFTQSAVSNVVPITVSFNAGLDPYSISDKYYVGDKIDASDAHDGGMPPVEGGSFKWFSIIDSVASEIAWDFDNDTIPGDMTLECCLANSLNYYNHDGSELLKTVYFKDSTGLTELYTPEIAGFAGWYTEADGGGTPCTSIEAYSGNVDLYAAVNAASNVISYKTESGAEQFSTSFVEGWQAAINASDASTQVTVKLYADWTATDESFGTGTGFAGGAISIASGKNIVLDLNGRTINRNVTSEETTNCTIINTGTLEITDRGNGQGRITGGKSTLYSDGGGIHNIGTLTISGGNITGNHGTYGGGIYNSGTVIMTGGSISNNVSDTFGGGIYNGGTVTVSGGSISGNTATCGGGILNSGDEGDIATVNISGNASITNNTGSSLGGGITNYDEYSETYVSGGDISGNTSEKGGGVCDYGGGVVNVSGGIISDNTANYGGGIHTVGSLNFTEGTIRDNTANAYGGGIYGSSLYVSGGATYTSRMTISGGSITGNTAATGGGISSYGELTINGTASITGNTAATGGGVNCSSTGGNTYSFIIGGTPYICGNTLTTDSSPNNLYLGSGRTFSIDSSLTSDAYICVSTEDAPPVAITGANSADYSNNFISDSDLYAIENSDDNILVLAVSEYSITYDADGGTMPGTYPQTFAGGETVTLPVPTKSGHEFIGWSCEYNGNVYFSELSDYNYDISLKALWDVPTDEAVFVVIKDSVEYGFANADWNLAFSFASEKSTDVYLRQTYQFDGSGGALWSRTLKRYPGFTGTMIYVSNEYNHSATLRLYHGVIDGTITEQYSFGIAGNTALSATGPVIYIDDNSYGAEISNVTIKNNKNASSNGGAIYCDASTYLNHTGSSTDYVTITGCSSANGGAIYASANVYYQQGTITITDNTDLSGRQLNNVFCTDGTVICGWQANVNESSSVGLSFPDDFDYTSTLAISANPVIFTCDKPGYIAKVVNGKLAFEVDTTEYTITYDFNSTGATFKSGYTPPATYTSGIAVSLPLMDNIDYPGRSLSGWYPYSAQDESNLSYGHYTEIPAYCNGNLVLRPSFDLIHYSITFELNGGTPVTRTVEGSGGMYEMTAFTYLTDYSYVSSIDLPTADDLTREGYTFGGWYDNIECEGEAITSIPEHSTGDRSFYAKWTANSYDITYDIDGGTWSGAHGTSYTYGTVFMLPTNLTKANYTFAGWYDNDDLTGTAVTSITATDSGNKSYYAKWTANSYDITYDINGGTWSGVHGTSYTYGTVFMLPTNLTKANYTFAGWYDNDDLTGTAVTSVTATDSGNKSFYAKWTANSYDITYDIDGGTWSGVHGTSYTYGTTFMLPTNLTKANYTFAGWYDNDGLTGTAVTSISATDSGNKNYYAKWTANSYDITYDVDGGTWVALPATSYTYGTTFMLPTNLTKTNYTFAGWYDNDDLTGTAVTSVTATDSGNKNYYAKWTANSYDITYDIDGGTWSGTHGTSYTYGTVFMLPTNLTKTNYTFAGWYDNDDLTGTAVTSIMATDSGNKTYYAKWTANSYNITYDIDGGTWSGAHGTSYTYGTVFMLPTNLTKANYTFAGWYDNDDLTGAAVTSISATDSGNKTYYAKWTANSYTITYNYSGGTPQHNDFSTSYSVEQSIVMPTLTRSGYVFAGWVVVKTGTTDIIYSGRRAPRNVTGDLTATAVWSRAYTPNRTERFVNTSLSFSSIGNGSTAVIQLTAPDELAGADDITYEVISVLTSGNTQSYTIRATGTVDGVQQQVTAVYTISA